MAWKFDDYGNARNKETNEEIHVKIWHDGLSRVFFNGRNIGAFPNNKDALAFIEEYVKELEEMKESEENEE